MLLGNPALTTLNNNAANYGAVVGWRTRVGDPDLHSIISSTSAARVKAHVLSLIRIEAELKPVDETREAGERAVRAGAFTQPRRQPVCACVGAQSSSARIATQCPEDAHAPLCERSDDQPQRLAPRVS
ncbi:hypothetical protein SRHO_G00276870 [Serrasalmus rhombeus]